VELSGHIRATARCFGFAAFAAGLGMAAAQAQTWNGATTDWNTATNWTPNTVPSVTATFSNTGSTTVDNASGNVTIGAISFTAVPNAQAYTINIDNTFTINGAGVTNSSTNTQIFNVNSATLSFNNSATAGSASITTNNGGSTNFTGTSSGGSAAFVVNTGGIFDISQLTNGGTTAGSIAGGGSFFLGHNTLTVGSLNTSTTVSGQILDGGLGAGIGGSLTKVGTGTLTLTNGGNLYGGATTIDGGTLTVNGAIPLSSGVAINAGGTLNGTGSVTAVTVSSGGILMPGPPGGVGTLTGSGAVTFNSGATYQIFISGAANSKLATTGAASLNGGASVAISNGSNIIVGDKYTILTATGGVTGQFNPTVRFSDFTGTLSYDADDAFITFGLSTLSPLLPAGAPQNAVNVAAAIDKLTTHGGTLPAGFAPLFSLSGGQLINGLEQLDGETSTGAQVAGFQLMNQFMSLLLDPFTEGHNNGIGPVPFAPVGEQTTFTPQVASAYASVLKAPLAPPMAAYNPWRAWGAAYGGSESIAGAPATVGSHDISARAGGFAAGLDYRASPDTVYGFALAGAATGWDLAQGFGSGHSDAFQAGVYGTHQMGQAYVSGALAFANYWAQTTRIVTVAGTDTLQANFDAQSFGARFEGGYRVNLAPVTLTPYAALQAQSFHTPNFAETAASGSPQFALNFAAQTSTAERAEAGSWISQNFMMGNGDSVTLFGRAAYAHDWFTNLAFTPTFQALPGASFVVNGVTPPPDLGLVTAGAEWHMARNLSLMARFDGEFGNGDQTYTGTARLRLTW
jgi:outer membrane autotransporter protein